MADSPNSSSQSQDQGGAKPNPLVRILSAVKAPFNKKSS